jgi:transcription initiation factor TFIIIB Brf1 subunit/transcription initiation factor TFIIB
MCNICGYVGSLKKNRYGEIYCSKCGFNYSKQMYFDFRDVELLKEATQNEHFKQRCKRRRKCTE